MIDQKCEGLTRIDTENSFQFDLDLLIDQATTVVAQLPDAKRHFSMVHVSAPLAETFALHSNGRALESAK